MSKRLHVIAGSTAALVGIALGSCTTPQPPAECSIFQDDYYVQLTKTGTSGICSTDSAGYAPWTANLTWVGATGFKYNLINDAGVSREDTFGVGIRSDGLDGFTGAGVNTPKLTCNNDLTNDCTKPLAQSKCQFCIAQDDGGVFPSGAIVGSDGKPYTEQNSPYTKLLDGTSAIDPTPLPDGGRQGTIVVPVDGGNPERASLTNFCQVKLETIDRFAALTKDAKKVELDNSIAIGTMHASAVSGVCAVSNTAPGTLRVPAFDCAGGTHFAAETVTQVWNDVKIISDGVAQSNIFGGSVTYAETNTETNQLCTTTYKAWGSYPITQCVTNMDCQADPIDAGVAHCPADTDGVAVDTACYSGLAAGLLHGSGLPGTLNPACDAANGYCYLKYGQDKYNK